MNTWKNSAELRKEIENWDGSQVEKLIAARRFSALLRGSLFLDKMDVYEDLADCVIPSDHAIFIRNLDEGLKKTNSVPFNISCLAALYHHDILIDLEKFDERKFEQLLSFHLSSGSISLPNRFGRELYDKFNRVFSGKRLDSLSNSETCALLKGVEQGVYQVGNFLTGPLGLIRSEACRTAPPSRSIPLWHCEDIGCNHLHNVALSDPNSYLQDTIDRLDNVAHNLIGPPSHWNIVASFLEDDDYEFHYNDLLIFIQNCFSLNEVRAIFVDLITSSHSKGRLWEIVRTSSIPKAGNLNPESLAGSLSDQVIFQLILCASNDSIISSIDKLTASGAISVPPTEARRTAQSIRGIGSTSTKCCLSSLGLRSEADNPHSRFAVTIWDAYENADRLNDLAWKTVKRGGEAVAGDILDYLRRTSIEDAVAELVMSSKDVFDEVCEVLSYNPPAEADDDIIVRGLLWKFGYDLPRFGLEYADILKHLDKFKSIILKCSDPLSGEDRELIRSVGVNLFVNLEWFLENVISYNVWLLHNDHLLSHFEYNPEVAVGMVGDVIPTSSIFTWDKKGGNTLGALQSYLSSVSSWMEGILEKEPTARPDYEYPHFSDPNSEMYPFHAKEFWGDYDRIELQRHVNSFKEISSLILRSDLAAIRNGLDHFRKADQFPTLNDMLGCEARVRQAVDLSDVRRLFPKRWWLKTRLSDNVGRMVETFVDERGEIIEVHYPSALLGIREATFGQAVIIPPDNPLGQANSTVLFHVVEPSDYIEKWRDYPARPPADNSEDPSVEA